MSPGTARLATFILNPDVGLMDSPAVVPSVAQGREVIWTDGLTSKVEPIGGRQYGLMPRKNEVVVQVVRLLLAATPLDHVKAHRDEVFRVLIEAFRARTSPDPHEHAPFHFVERMVLSLLTVNPDFDYAIARGLRKWTREPTEVADLWAQVAITSLTNPRACSSSEMMEELATGGLKIAPGLSNDVLCSLLSALVRIANSPLALRFLLSVLQVAADKVADTDLERMVPSEVLLKFLEDARVAGSPMEDLKGQLIDVIANVYFSQRAITRAKVLSLMKMSLVPRPTGSQLVLPSALKIFNIRYGGLHYLWHNKEENVGEAGGEVQELGCQLIRCAAWGLASQDGAVICRPSLMLLRSLVAHDPAMVRACLEYESESALLDAFTLPAQDDGMDNDLKDLRVLCYLELAVASPVKPYSTRLRWLGPLLTTFSGSLAGALWHEKDLKHVMCWMYHVISDPDASPTDKAEAKAASAHFLHTLLAAHEDISLDAGVRCLSYIATALKEENTRDIFRFGLTDFLPRLLSMLRAEQAEVRDKTALVMCELMKLKKAEREILLKAYGSSESAGEQEDIAELNEGGAGDLFLLDAFNEKAGSADRVPPAIEASHFDNVRNDLMRWVQAPEGQSLDDVMAISQHKDEDELSHGGVRGPEEGIVLTTTMKENLNKVLELSKTGSPILLEGDTGVGKSATIMTAAAMSGNSLVRFNMSRTVTIDELLGQVIMGPGPNKKFAFIKQPFTVAFETGKWLLLDEVNLAQDNVVQCIEEAIDVGRLVIKDSSSASSGRLVGHQPSPNQMMLTLLTNESCRS